MMRHGPFPGLGSGAGHRRLEPLPSSEFMENKITAQVAEMERLSRENQRLAAARVALRQDLVAAQKEMQRLQEHIGSIQTESDIQIRMLLEKNKKMEVDIRAGESTKIDLQQAHKEAQSLITTRQDLASKIQQATQELQKAHYEVANLPELDVELNKLRQEHQRLRAAFEFEKVLNMEKVEQMHAREKKLISMAREVEKLRAEVSNAEKRANAPYPYGSPFSSPDISYPHQIQGSGVYVNGYGRPQLQMGGGAAENGVDPYAGASSNGGGAAVGSGGNGAVASRDAWGGSYNTIRADTSLVAQRQVR